MASKPSAALAPAPRIDAAIWLGTNATKNARPKDVQLSIQPRSKPAHRATPQNPYPHSSKTTTPETASSQSAKPVRTLSTTCGGLKIRNMFATPTSNATASPRTSTKQCLRPKGTNAESATRRLQKCCTIACMLTTTTKQKLSVGSSATGAISFSEMPATPSQSSKRASRTWNTFSPTRRRRGTPLWRPGWSTWPGPEKRKGPV